MCILFYLASLSLEEVVKLLNRSLCLDVDLLVEDDQRQHLNVGINLYIYLLWSLNGYLVDSECHGGVGLFDVDGGLILDADAPCLDGELRRFLNSESWMDGEHIRVVPLLDIDVLNVDRDLGILQLFYDRDAHKIQMKELW
ncbi:hypothetical protein NDU88_004938 [Pleurodeles waltl]|uniref:Uncharacterized protein n=1 Tax=Pleurodeles waltl TaxID=8319 RepID=A0AAV7MD39_PLEWA|nr:hypothetical protein NDU88_004938 [Pleurodeles waltl]